MARIVHWGKYYPPDMGGIESVTSSLAKGAAAAGHEATVVCFDKNKVREETDLHGVRVRRAPIFWHLASQPIGWRYFRWLLKEGRRADIVHLHAPNMLAALATAFLGHKPRLLVHWHSDVVSKGLLGQLFRPVETMMLHRADAVICTSPPYAEASSALRPFRDKISVIPLGVPDESSAGTASGETLPNELSHALADRRLVLSIGRLVAYKGFETLIDAAPHLPTDTVVVIVGTGPLHEALQARIVEAGATGRIILAGRQSAGALLQLFKHAKLYCMPSVERSEAFGVVLIEAMSHRLPIIATNIPGSGVPWVNQHGESGLNVSPGNPRSLADACSQLLADGDLRERLANGARKRYEAEFCEDVSVSRMNLIYEVLSSPGNLGNSSSGKKPIRTAHRHN